MRAYCTLQPGAVRYGEAREGGFRRPRSTLGALGLDPV